jgi:hypothetical protein
MTREKVRRMEKKRGVKILMVVRLGSFRADPSCGSLKLIVFFGLQLFEKNGCPGIFYFFKKILTFRVKAQAEKSIPFFKHPLGVCTVFCFC